MKTIGISEETWKAAKVAAAERAMTLADVIAAAVAQWTGVVARPSLTLVVGAGLPMGTGADVREAQALPQKKTPRARQQAIVQRQNYFRAHPEDESQDPRDKPDEF